MSNEFLLNSKVRFTQERLAVLTPRDRQNLAGRIGVVQTDGTRVTKPTVYFPADGARLDLRLFNVDPRQLEWVEGPPTADTQAPAPGVDAAPAADAGAGEKLSQSEMDNLFD